MKAAVLAAIMGCAQVAHAAGGSRDGLGPLAPGLLAAVAHGATTVSIVPVRGDDYSLLWAVWGDSGTGANMVRLVLLKRAGTKVRALWSERRAGYAPAVTPIDEWSYAGRGVTLVQYQEGAASVRSELLGVDAKGGAKVLGALEGSLIQVSVLDGGTVLRVHRGADLKLPPSCYVWNGDANTLNGAACAAPAQ